MKQEYDILEAIEFELAVKQENSYNLIVWNDEVNKFDWVIDTLVTICGHTNEQAEQSAMIIHTKGKYAVKNGTFTFLKPLCEAIIDRGINATIETSVEK